jgi:hypothetical protein
MYNFKLQGRMPNHPSLEEDKVGYDGKKRKIVYLGEGGTVGIGVKIAFGLAGA